MPRTPGAVAYKPTAKDAKEVSEMASIGLTIKQISKIKGVSERTLKNHFQRELTLGRESGLQKLFEKAHTEALNGNSTMLIFLLKTRGGLVERRPIRVDEEGNPVGDVNVNVNTQNPVLVVPGIAQNEEEWIKLAKIHSEAAIKRARQ